MDEQDSLPRSQGGSLIERFSTGHATVHDLDGNAGAIDLSNPAAGLAR